MAFFIGDLKVVDTRKDDIGNTYHLTLSRSLLLSIFCEMGIKETTQKDKYYLNYVSILKNSDLKDPLGTKNFSFEPSSLELIKITSKKLLTDYISNKSYNSFTQREVEDLSERLIEEIFITDQRKIDDKINLFLPS